MSRRQLDDDKIDSEAVENTKEPLADQVNEADDEDTAGGLESSGGGYAAEEEVLEAAAHAVDEMPEERPADGPVSAQLRHLEETNLRLRAEFANYKKRIEREQADYSEYLKCEVIKEMLPIWDDFKIMLDKASGEEHEDGMLEGARMIYKKFATILDREGVKQIDALGEKFDPQIHEALMMKPIDSEDDHEKVIEVFQEGFRLNDRLIRPSKVVVGNYRNDD